MNSLPLLVSLPDEPASIEFLARELSWSNETTGIAQELYARQLPPLVDRLSLPFIFGVSAKLVSSMSKLPENHYRVFTIPKANGADRRIEAPRRFLKVIQRWVHDHILSTWTAPANVTGFARGRSIFDNARLHAPGRNLMVIDIANFFPTIQSRQVIEVLSNFGFPGAVSGQLASLCTLEGRLPQGAPTSPQLSNLVFEPVDSRLDQLAAEWGCTYSRYADDLAFSGATRFGNEHRARVVGLLEEHGYSANVDKSRIVGPGGCQVIAGVVTNQQTLPPRLKRRRWRAMFHQASADPQDFADRLPTLMGVAAFVKQYDPDTAATYRTIAERVAAQRRVDA